MSGARALPASDSLDERTLRDHIWVRDDGIIEWIEVARPTEYSIGVFREEILAKARPGPVDILIDLTQAGRPDAPTREGLRTIFSSIPDLGRVAAFTEKNIVLNSAARFVLRKTCPGRSSVHKKKQEALDAIQAARAERRASR